MMIMEAMRLSLLDHEEHQRKINTDQHQNRQGESTASASGSAGAAGPSSASGEGNGGNGNGKSGTTGTNSPTPSTSSRRSSRAADTLTGWRQSESGGRAAKLLSKITVNRSRANSKSSVHFAPSPTTLGAPGTSSPGGSGSGSASGSRARSSSTPSPVPGVHTEHHQPSPLSANVTTRRSLDVTPRASAAQALQAALGPAEPASAETSAAAAEASDSPLSRELAAASGPDAGAAEPHSGLAPAPTVSGAPIVESPLTELSAPGGELAPAPVVEAAPGEDLLRFDSTSTGAGLAAPAEPSSVDPPALDPDVTPGASPSRRNLELEDIPAQAPEAAGASPASLPADSLALASGQPSSVTSLEPSPALPSPNAPACDVLPATAAPVPEGLQKSAPAVSETVPDAASTPVPAPVAVPDSVADSAAPTPVPAPTTPSVTITPASAPFKPTPQRADTSTSLVSVDAASFVSHSSFGTQLGAEDEVVRRPSGPLASKVDDEDY